MKDILNKKPETFKPQPTHRCIVKIGGLLYPAEIICVINPKKVKVFLQNGAFARVKIEDCE